MPVTEKSGLLKYKDKAGNLYIMLPITNTDNVDGLDEMIDGAKIVGTAVAATSTDGVAYTATVPGITALTAGDSFIMIPDKISTSRSTTLNVNNLGAKNLRVRVSGYSGTTSSPMTANWLASNKPVRVTYDGMWWIAEVVLPSAQQLYGNVPAEDVTYSNTNSGMTATDVQEAIDELAGGKTSTQVLTTAEYNALTDKNENVLYMLSDAEDEDNAVRLDYILSNENIALPSSANWKSVCYGDGKFVAVAYSSDVAAYSTDGINWTQTTMPASGKWYSVCYGDGKFVAVAYSSDVAAYSTDGINWTQTTMPASGKWYSVCYGDGKFVAVAYSSDVAAYSTDGINWTQITMPASKNWSSVCYGDGKFVAVAYSSNIAVYSTDGINWTQTTMPASGKWYSVCYGNGKFVAVAYSSNIAVYSTDGINWTQITMPASANWYSVCYGNGKFVAAAYSSKVIIYSTDGINWTDVTMPTSGYWISVCYGNGKFVAVTDNSNIAVYSTDGINWTNKKTVSILQNSSGEDISEDVKIALDISADDVGADSKGSAAQALTDAKAYADEAIAAIPTPDVSGQIATHNSDSSAHQDIRDALENLSSNDSVILADAKAYADVADQGILADAQQYADSTATGMQSIILDSVDLRLQTKAPAYTYGTSDMTAGSSSLSTGVLYFVYE